MFINKGKFIIFSALILIAQSESGISKEDIKQLKSKSSLQFMVQTIDIYSDNQKLFSYVYDESQYKPYVKELFTPNGINILLDSPDDHKHHHGLMFAVKVDGINFWEETPQSGKQLQTSTSKIGNKSKTITGVNEFLNEILWIAPDTKDVFLSEKRRIRIESSPKSNINLLSWKSEFFVPESKKFVTLTGAHYHGLGMRFIRAMDKKGHFFTATNKKGKIFRGSEQLIPDRWCAYIAQNERGQKVTIAMFSDPDNTGGETIWFTMKDPFAYLSATMTLHEKSLNLKYSETILLQYGVALWDGEIDTEKVEKIYQYWLDQLKR
jgi:hypothetical protein